MPVKAVKQVSTVVKNGLGSYVQPCYKIVLRYCNWGGSSAGMRELLRKDLLAVAKKYPQIEFVAEKKQGHPIVQGHYANGLTKTVCVRNLEPSDILKKIALVRESSGNRLKKYDRAVESTNTSVRGIWSPLYVEKDFRYRV